MKKGLKFLPYIYFVLFIILANTSLAVDKNNQPIPFSINVDELFLKLQTTQVPNVVEAVSLFSDEFFKQDNYALVFNSLSPQRSAPDSPRVLLFGKDKKLRIGFNHNSPSGQDLEIIQWRETTATWEFREISFKSGQPRISQINPGMCIQCHRDHKPKFNSTLMHTLSNSLKENINKSSFSDKIDSDSIYERLENPYLN